jgi:hypothetical protein
MFAPPISNSALPDTTLGFSGAETMLVCSYRAESRIPLVIGSYTIKKPCESLLEPPSTQHYWD